MRAGQLHGVREIVGYGTIRTSGLNGTVRIAVDRSRGAFAERAALYGIGPYAKVYDGKTLWSQDISGGVHSLNAPFPKQEAITRAYISRYGFLTAAPNAACLPSRVENGRPVLVVSVQPHGGIPATLYVNARTHLLDGYSERFPIDVQETTFSDYRSVGGVMLPFHITSGSVFEPANVDLLTIQRYSLNRVTDSTDFAKPEMQNAARMDAGAHSTTVPMRIEDGKTLIWASINHHPAMPFLVDTGGHAILTTAAAAALNLKQVGSGQSGGSGGGTVALRYAHVAALRIGAATLPQQNFLVIDYPRSFSYRGPGKEPLAGILGLEIFEHFRVTLNYGKGSVTLAPVGARGERPSGRATALYFDDDMPLADAAIDGHTGLFGIDTGNSGAVIAYHSFLQRTGLIGLYRKGRLVKGSGTGGSNTALIVRVRALQFGGEVFRNVRAAFTDMTSGSFSSWTEAGDIGYGQISPFAVTFDFENSTFYLAPRNALRYH